LVLAVCLLSYRTYQIGVILQHDHNDRHTVKVEQVECNLPCRCKHLLNLGTWEWAECMGVGKK
jgi:hypothetical protein